MPHLGHAIIGLGIGAATVSETRRPAVQAAWLGSCVLLAFLPDLVEWLAVLAGLRLPRSAPAALILVIPCVALVSAVLWLGFRERRWPLHAAAAAAVLSHTLLDALDGGIPLLWPWVSRDLGWGDAFGLGALRGGARIHAELVTFMPLMALGVLIRALRIGREGDRLVALLGLAASFSAAVFTLGLLVIFSWTVIAAAVWRLRPRVWSRAYAANLALVVPVLLLGVVQVHSRWHLLEGERLRGAERYGEAIEHYQAARRFGALDSVTDPLYYESLCLNELDRGRDALVLLETYLRSDPRNELMRYGLAHLRVTARDAAVRNVEQGLRLARELAADGESEHLRGHAERLLERAATGR